jgi:hypothetical protein
MDASCPTPSSSVAGPLAEYRRRYDLFRVQHLQLERRLAWLGNSRFVLLIAGILLLGLVLLFGWFHPLWLLLPLAVFIGLSIAFDRVSRRNRYVKRALAFYDYGLARLEDRWAGSGIPGTAYLDEGHAYAVDLDLFGPGSLFERLCSARTRTGRETLAHWLGGPAPPEEIRARQAAVADLRDRLAWRERLAMFGDDVPEGIDTVTLATWGTALTGPASARSRLLAPCVVAVTLTTLAGWSVDWWPGAVAALALLVQMGFAQVLRPRVSRALAGLEGRSRDLFQLAGLLACIEREAFTAPRLSQLQDALRSEGVSASQRLVQLAQLVERLDARRNLYFAIIAVWFLWTTQVALAVEAWRRRTGPILPRWLTVIAEVEALASLAGYAYENPQDPFPEIVPDGPRFEATGLGHPLIPRSRCVTNDLGLGDPVRLLVVSGSNMSGKSTFLRTVGINAVLAQAGAPVRAASLRLSPLAIGTTVRIQDSLQAGRSRFYAEITRLHQILERTKGPLPVLFLLDEILHGTNSHDRRIGAEAVLRALLQRPAIGLVTTHDLALTEITEQLVPRAANVHFADQLADGALHFDYRLHPGVVRHSNALALMRAVGLDVGDGG